MKRILLLLVLASSGCFPQALFGGMKGKIVTEDDTQRFDCMAPGWGGVRSDFQFWCDDVAFGGGIEDGEVIDLWISARDHGEWTQSDDVDDTKVKLKAKVNDDFMVDFDGKVVTPEVTVVVRADNQYVQ